MMGFFSRDDFFLVIMMGCIPQGEDVLIRKMIMGTKRKKGTEIKKGIEINW